MPSMPDVRELQQATDADLRQLIFTHDQVLVKFIDADCAFCKALAPKMQGFANDLRFAHVLFLSIDAAENPVSAQTVTFTSAPFFAAYQQGRLIHCETVYTAARIEEILLTYLAE